MKEARVANGAFELEVTRRFGILPNFFRSAHAPPELLEQLWGFAKAGYLDNPMPSVFKERLFVWLSRFCPMRYCIVRHVGFLLGGSHGRAAGDAGAPTQTVDEIMALLRRPTPWNRDMSLVYADLTATPARIAGWPDPGSGLEDAIFACAAIMFVEPARGEQARHALMRMVGLSEYELFSGCLAFIRAAHYWTMLHPEIETEADMTALLGAHEALAQLLLEDPEATRCEMSERMFAELTQLRDLNERDELRAAKEALEEKDRQKDQFIAVLAHELRNPLSSIRIAPHTLRLLNLEDERAAPIVERVARQSTAIARMQEDLLDTSRIAFGKVSVQLEAFELQGLLSDVLEEHGLHARAAGLALLGTIAEEVCMVSSDRMRLRQIVDNLLSNAIKFTPAGGKVELSLAMAADTAVIAVRDTGTGFDALLADKLFEPFVQGCARGSGGQGLGLGLAIASRLATLLGGRLSATSPGVGRGALFTLTIPTGNAPDAPSRRARRPAGGISKRILLVEDDRDIADGLAQLLQLEGASVAVTRDGAAALQSALERVPDLILCDLGLPGEMDGCAVARACRTDAALMKIRLVAVSGYSSTGRFADAMAAGFDSYLVKPLTEDAVRALAQ
jgi:signal transduction histidine kinase